MSDMTISVESLLCYGNVDAGGVDQKVFLIAMLLCALTGCALVKPASEIE